MNEIRAVVGHSFAADDSLLVEKFLKYFDQISRSPLNFTWTSAENAEPTELARKILRIFDDKNVFIAICTRNELVATTARINSAKLISRILRNQDRSYQWKASDWIIQEIGLAIGRGLDLIVLLENGVRKPGSIQGDREHIAFDRDYPERSFGKIIEMITALAPKTPAMTAPAVSPGPIAADGMNLSKDEKTTNSMVPASNWTIKDYDRAIFSAMFMKDLAAIDEINKAFASTSISTIADNLARWHAQREWIAIISSNDGNLEKLEQISELSPSSVSALSYLGYGLEHYNSFAKATTVFLKAAALSADKLETIRLMDRAAVAASQGGNHKKSWEVINQMKLLAAGDRDAEIQTLITISQIAGTCNESQVMLGALDRISVLKTGDVSALFEIAYQHSQFNNDDVSLARYREIPVSERSPAAWNNIGAAYKHAEMPCKAVAAYRLAADEGETLAMSNLALAHLSAGFDTDARKMCTAAMEHKDYHKNIVTTLAAINDAIEDEGESEAALLAKVARKSEFYRAFGGALLAIDIESLVGTWRSPLCNLKIDISQGLFAAEGEYTQSNLNALGGLAMFGSAAPAEIRHRIRYNGIIRGQAIAGTVKRSQEPETGGGIATLLGGLSSDSQFLIVIEPEMTKMNIMEFSKNSGPEFYAVERLEPPAQI